MAAASSPSNSVCNSQSSTNASHLSKKESQQDISSEIKGSEEHNKGSMEDKIDFVESEEQIKKFQKYEADFRQHLMSKYFSSKNVFGGKIYDATVNLGAQTIAASRFPPFQSFIDPTFFEELESKESISSADTPTGSTSNDKTST